MPPALTRLSRRARRTIAETTCSLSLCLCFLSLCVSVLSVSVRKPPWAAQACSKDDSGNDVPESGSKRILRVIKILRILKILRLLKGIKLVECAVPPTVPGESIALAGGERGQGSGRYRTVRTPG